MDSIRSSWWSITINNPTEEDRLRLLEKNFPSFVKYWKAQEEVGKEGTPHIQGALQTTQTRLSAVKGWLPRAHIEVAKDKVALLKYVEKAETAVEGTQVVIKADYLAMEDALKAIANNRPTYDEWLTVASLKDKATTNAFYKWEFWKSVNAILLEKPKTVGLFTNPQLERAWINTRLVWINIVYQTKRQDIVENIGSLKNEILDIQDAHVGSQVRTTPSWEGSPVPPPCGGGDETWTGSPDTDSVGSQV